MAGPVNGIGGQQQIPLANAAQSSQSNQVRPRQEREPEENKVQPREAAAAESQNTETRNNDNILQEQLAAALSQSRDNGGNVKRGSVVDLTV